MKKILIPIIIILIVLGIAQVLYSQKGISSKKAGEIVVNYIDEVLAGQATATLVEDAVKENGVYKLKLKIGEQEMTSYLSLDGKLIFPSGIEVTADTTANDNANSNQTADIPKEDKTSANLFVMSFCPYGNQAEDAMKPVAELLKDKADIQLHYVIYANYQGGGSAYCLDKDSKYCSMHGIQELNQDVRELCVQKYQQDKLWSFIDAINDGCTYQDADSCWEAIAKNVGIDTNKIKTCQKNEAISLLEQEVQLNDKYGISGSPQIVINDTEYTGGRSADAYKTAVCSGFSSEPSECEQTLSTDGGTTSGGCE